MQNIVQPKIRNKIWLWWQTPIISLGFSGYDIKDDLRSAVGFVESSQAMMLCQRCPGKFTCHGPQLLPEVGPRRTDKHNQQTAVIWSFPQCTWWEYGYPMLPIWFNGRTKLKRTGEQHSAQAFFIKGNHMFVGPVGLRKRSRVYTILSCITITIAEKYRKDQKKMILHKVEVVPFNRMVFVRYHFHLLMVQSRKEDIGMRAKARQGDQIQWATQIVRVKTLPATNAQQTKTHRMHSLLCWCVL